MATVAGTARDGLVDYAFRVGWAITRHAPEPVAEKLLEGAADRVTRSQRDGVRQLARNLSRAVPERTTAERDALLRQAMRSYFRYWHEAFRLPSWSEQRIVDTVVTTNEQPLRDGFRRACGQQRRHWGQACSDNARARHFSRVALAAARSPDE